MSNVWRLSILAVDDRNLIISPRVAATIETLCREHGIEDIVVDSAGTDIDLHMSEDVSREQYGVNRPTRLSKEMIAASDIIVAVDRKTAVQLKEKYGVDDAVVLGMRKRSVPLRNNKHIQFRALLREKLGPFVDRWTDQVRSVEPSPTWKAIIRTRKASMLQ